MVIIIHSMVVIITSTMVIITSFKVIIISSMIIITFIVEQVTKESIINSIIIKPINYCYNHYFINFHRVIIMNQVFKDFVYF
jgi:hypothetical protein